MSARAADLVTATSARLVLRRWHMIALVALLPAMLAAAYVTTNVQASLAQRALRAEWETIAARQPVEPAALAASSPAPGHPVARLGIPAIGVDLIVVEGGAGTRRGPAHATESVLPGLPGVAIVEAGRFGYGNMFLHVERLLPGDAIVVETAAGRQRFTVRDVSTVPAAQVDASTDSMVPTLLLVAPARAWGSDERIVVRAEAGSSDG